MRAFDQVRHWPVETAAIAAVAADGRVLGEYGPQQRCSTSLVRKLLSAYAALIAVEEGALDLDDAAGPPGATIRHLLAHASGVAPESVDVVAKVGTRRIYSNAGFEMLAEAVEAATSMSFAAYLNEAVIEPLGMSASELVGSPAAGARSTVADLHRFVAELQRPRLLAEQTVREATSVAFPGLSGVLPGTAARIRTTGGSASRSATASHRIGRIAQLAGDVRPLWSQRDVRVGRSGCAVCVRLPDRPRLRGVGGRSMAPG